MSIDFSIFNPSKRPLIGLDVSSSSVKMVELSRREKGKEGYCVERYVIEPLPRDAVAEGRPINIEVVADAIERAWKRLGTKTRFVAMALPTSSVITKKIILPADLGEREMEFQVESEANQYIPFALDEVNLDFQVIGPVPTSPDEVEVLIAASRKELVEDRVACAEAAGLQPLVVDIESSAAHAAFELVEEQLPNRGVDKIIALVDIGANMTNVSMLRNGALLYSREQAFGGSLLTREVMRLYGMGFEEAEASKRTGTLPENYEVEVLHPFLQNLSVEVGRMIQFFYSSTAFSSIDHIVLAGGCAVIPGVAEVVANEVQIKTTVANPFEGMELSAKVRPRNLQSDAPALLNACGLALRRFDE